MKPSDIKNKHPFRSVFENYESEIVAQNIAIILARTDNEFHRLTWDEYLDERMKDGWAANKVMPELPYFEKVEKYLVSEDAARKFSQEWNI